MGATRVRTTRLAGVAVLMGVLVGGGLPAGPTAKAVPTCFGKQATIADHSGKILGTDGDDVIIGNGGNNWIAGKGGTDRICGGAGDDYLLGFDGNDYLYGQDGKDALFGHGGGDMLFGGNGPDSLWGGDQSDVCDGGPGLDTVADCETAGRLGEGAGGRDHLSAPLPTDRTPAGVTRR